MSARNDGGSAFPVQGLSGLPNGDVVWPEGGMTLRDYFIAHAPAEPQPWFEPVLNIAAPVMPKVPPNLNKDESETLHDVGEGYITAVDVSSQRLREYLEARDAYTKLSHAYRKALERARYVQWPFAWADEILAEREAS